VQLLPEMDVPMQMDVVEDTSSPLETLPQELISVILSFLSASQIGRYE
jgi:hypothetical protein